MLIICDDNQRVIAYIKATPKLVSYGNVVSRSKDFKEVFDLLKRVPPQLATIEVNYPLVGSDFIQLNSGKQMDIENIVGLQERKDADEEADKTLFIAPSPDELPSDGVLFYATIETIYDIGSVPDRSVILVRDDQTELVRCIADNTKLFGVKLTTLTGLPSANYSVAFDEATWAFDKVAYAPFISDLRVAGEIESQLEAQNRTQYDVEKASYTRKTGEVKEFKDFTSATVEDDDGGDETESDEMRL